jgi:nitroreductase
MNGPFLSLCQTRYSCRAYRPDPVPREHIEKMLEAARMAPSACNKQPWRFAVALDPETRTALCTKGLLPGFPARWVADAPVLIALGMKKSLVVHKLAPLLSGADYPWIDIGIAGEHLVLQATELGLGTCWIGWIRPDAIRRVLDWPRDIQPAALITVGWPKEDAGANRTPRLPMDQIVMNQS